MNHWLLVASLAAVGLGCLLGALALWIWLGSEEVEEHTEEEAGRAETVHDCNDHEPYEVLRVLPPVEPLRTAAERAEVAEKTAWLATVARTAHVREDEQIQTEPLLCDQPARPPHGSEAWLSIRLATMRHRPVSWRRLDDTIPPGWVELISSRAKAMEPTQEITPETLAKVLGGVR